MPTIVNKEDDTEHPLIDSNRYRHGVGATANQVRSRSFRNFSEALGWTWIATIIGSFLVMLCECALLLFIWIESARRITHHPTTSFWMRISDPRYLTLIITASSMVLRLAVASQAAICGSLLAFLILRSSRCPLPGLPAMLMIRAGRSSSPENIIMTLGFSNTSARLEWVAAAAMATAVLGLQATSTLLASDLKLVDMDGEATFRDVPFGFRLGEGIELPLGLPEGEITDPWINRPSVYPAFAEYREPPATGDNFVDTGLTMRAMLPFLEKEDREGLRGFSGPARLLEAQVVCVQPAARMNISLQYDLDRAGMAVPPKEPLSAKYISGLSDGYLKVSGEVEWTDPLPMLDLPEIPYRGILDSPCTIPTPERPSPNLASEAAEALVIMCLVEPSTEEGYSWPPGLRSYIASAAEKKSSDNSANCDDVTDSATLGDGLCRSQPIAFAVFRADSTPDLWKEAFPKRGSKPKLSNDETGIVYPRREWSWAGTSAGAWATLEAFESGPELSVSLCFTSNMMRSRRVDWRARGAPPKDATMAWSASAHAWNVSGLAALLARPDAHPPPVSAFELSRMDDWSQSLGLGELGEERFSTGVITWKNRTGSLWDDGGYESNHALRWTSRVGAQVSLCTRCKSSVVRIHPAHIALFQAVLAQTSNLGLAVQALLTTILQAAYYEFLPHMTMEGPARFTMSISRTIPVRWLGLSVVLCLVGVQLTSVVVILWAFYVAEDDGLKFCVGETWQAVKHANCGPLEGLLGHVGDKTDEEVKNMLAEKGGELHVGIDSDVLGLDRLFSARSDEEIQTEGENASQRESLELTSVRLTALSS